jgi:sugar phosphate isomerase/epimerase
VGEGGGEGRTGRSIALKPSPHPNPLPDASTPTGNRIHGRVREREPDHGALSARSTNRRAAGGISSVSAHFGFDLWEKDPEGTAKQAAELGLKFAGVAWITHKGDLDERTARHAADVFNKAGKATAAHGIKFFYHNHGYEFAPREGGTTLFDLIVKETDPKLVSFEMDILWTVHPGQDPAALLAKYPDRWALLHLKDLKKGVPTHDFTGHTDLTNDVTLGTGQVDWKSLIEAVAKTQVQYAFIEDESPTVLDQIPNSLKFLAQFQK